MTIRSPLAFLFGFEKVHSDAFASEDNHAGLIAVTPLIQTRVVRITSLKTTYSGGVVLARTEDGWMKTSSDTPSALYGTPLDVAYFTPAEDV